MDKLIYGKQIYFKGVFTLQEHISIIERIQIYFRVFPEIVIMYVTKGSGGIIDFDAVRKDTRL